MIKLYRHHFRHGPGAFYTCTKAHRLLDYLWEPLWIHRDFTLRDLFEIITVELELWTDILQLYALKELANEFKRMKDADRPKKPWVDKLKICRYMEIWDYGKGREIVEWDDVSGSRQGAKIGRSVSFSPLGDLLHCKVVLEKEMWLTDWTKKKPQTISMGRAAFTVLDVVRAIIYELTFYGTPEQRDAQLQELNKTVLAERRSQPAS